MVYLMKSSVSHILLILTIQFNVCEMEIYG